MGSIWLAFITGLTTGGVSCMAVQGGLLSSALAQKKETDSNTWYVSVFIAAKIIAYTLLGFGLGLLGSKLTITPQFQGWLQIFAGIFMLLTVGRILDLHPYFRYFVIQPPKFAYKLLKNQTRAQSLFAPFLLGALTVLIPCGITQGMMVLAIASGSAITAAGIMFGFTIGTSPLFLALGLASAKFMKEKAFVYLSAIVIFILGILSINTGQVLRGSAHTLQNYWRAVTTVPGQEVAAAGTTAGVNTEGKQEVTIQVSSNGYSSSAKTIKAGMPVKLTLVTNNTGGCSRAFTIPALRISKLLPVTGTETLEFTPDKTGNLTYTCSMGMYSGSFNVI